MNSSLPWHAIYTRTNHEKKVSTLLERKGIRYYCPLNQVQEKNSVQRKWISAPLFPSVIFVQLPADKKVESLSAIPYVINPLYRLSEPAVFADAEITAMQHFVEAHETLVATKTSLSAVYAPAVSQYLPTESVYTLNLPSLGYTLSAKAEPVTVVKLVGKTTSWYRSADSLAFILGLKKQQQ